MNLEFQMGLKTESEQKGKGLCERSQKKMHA